MAMLIRLTGWFVYVANDTTDVHKQGRHINISEEIEGNMTYYTQFGKTRVSCGLCEQLLDTPLQ